MLEWGEMQGLATCGAVERQSMSPQAQYTSHHSTIPLRRAFVQVQNGVTLRGGCESPDPVD